MIILLYWTKYEKLKDREKLLVGGEQCRIIGGQSQSEPPPNAPKWEKVKNQIIAYDL